MSNFGMSMMWFWLCYVIVTCVGVLHTVFNICVLKMKPMDENGMGEGYEKAKPWHPLYNIVLFSLSGWVLIKHPWSLTFREFYADYQPWITLIYAAIFLGPVNWLFFTAGIKPIDKIILYKI